MTAIQPCLLMPVFNHGREAVATLAQLRRFQLPCVVVDDGSDPANSAPLRELAAREDWLHLHQHAHNQGKGAAVITGLRAAASAGFTHALQIDADGQHDTDDVPKLLQAAEAHPQAMILGQPQYDETVPRHRKIARYLTHVWVWINTLSVDIADSMCGFRVYPLAQTLPVLDSAPLSQRMAFDSDILVRLHWRGVPFMNVPTRVIYHPDGVSHFLLWRDNVLISKMHARLFFGMLVRAPQLLWRRWRRGGQRLDGQRQERP